ncbi:MAG: patatin-like phospholipase family protein [archaeon]
MKIGLALGSGGARALASIGVIKVLEKNNIEITEISGSSMGALIGAYYCAHLEIDGLEKKVLSMGKKDFLKLVDMNNPFKSMIKGQKIRVFIEKLIGVQDFSQLKLPLKIIASDLLKAEEVILNKGSLTDAIMASICIPGLFPPIQKGTSMLVDGGILNATPIEVLSTRLKIGVDYLITEKHVPKLDIFNTLSLSFSLMRKVGASGKLINTNKTVIIQPKTGLELEGLMRFDKVKNFIEAGEKAAQKSIRRINNLK